MPLYEHVFIARQDISSAQVESLIADFSGIIDAQGGSIAGHEYWGLKTMAYRIKKNRKGHYVLMKIDAEPAAVAEMERNLQLNEDVLRHLTLRVDEFEEGPSVMMQGKRDGDRRGPRSDRRDGPPRGRDSGERAPDGASDGAKADQPAAASSEKPGDTEKTDTASVQAGSDVADTKETADPPDTDTSGDKEEKE